MSDKPEGSSPNSGPSPTRPKPRLKHIQVALDRATAKNKNAPGWPRLVASLRRNQSAINEALIAANAALLETAEWLRNRVASLESEVANQPFAPLLAPPLPAQSAAAEPSNNVQQRLYEIGSLLREQDSRIASLGRKLDQRARLATEEEQRVDQLRRQLLELAAKLEQSEQRTLDERRLLLEHQKELNHALMRLLGE